MGWEKCKGAMLSIVLVRGVRGPKSGKAMKIKKKNELPLILIPLGKSLGGPYLAHMAC